MEELLDQKKVQETSLAQRGGLLSVLLHQTTSNVLQTDSNTINVENVKNEPTTATQLSSIS